MLFGGISKSLVFNRNSNYCF